LKKKTKDNSTAFIWCLISITHVANYGRHYPYHKKKSIIITEYVLRRFSEKLATIL